MILITGATGHLGRAVIQTLLMKLPADEIAAFVRDAQKASDLEAQGVDLRVGDYDNVASIESAMQGIEKVLLISGGNVPNPVQQHNNVIDAAKKAKVTCFTYTGRSLKNRETLKSDLMDTHFQTEDLIIQSGMNYILFRNSFYMDSLDYFLLGPDVARTGINLPAGNGKVAFALRSEMGEAIANVLVNENCNNNIYNFTGAESYSFVDVAETLSELMNKPIKYNSLTPEMYLEQLKERGTPEHMAEQILNFMLDIKNGQEELVSSSLENKLGRKPTTLKEGLKQLLNL